MNKFDAAHISNTVAYANKIDRVFNRVINQVALIASNPAAKFSKSFSFKDNHTLTKQAGEIFGGMYDDVYGVIGGGIENEWQLSNNKNDVLVNNYVSHLTKAKEKADWTDRNTQALKAFTERQVGGIDLSGRVWNLVDQFQTEMEIQLGLGILNGDSSAIISRRMRQYLKDPTALFRRVRNEMGELEWSKAAKAFHPGQGVYRSAYKNARRLAVTETNAAYRSSDNARWNNLGFVTGFDIVLSGSHPATDMCDDLKGTYPKSFIFTGWHPQCLCYAIPSMMKPEDYDKYEDAILDGKEAEYMQKVKGVTDTPQGFKDWINDNIERAPGWKNLPYFMQDNSGYVSRALKDDVIQRARQIVPEFGKVARV